MMKNCLDNLHSIKNIKDLTMKQMFGKSEKLISENWSRFMEWTQINWENSSWTHLSVIDDEKVICLSHSMWHLPWKNKTTCCGGTIWPIVRSKCDVDKHTFDWWFCTRSFFFFAKVQKKSGKVVTTRQTKRILYGCRISECCWNRTVFHDWRHCRIFTLHICSGLSWVHFAKRRRNIWTERLDQRKSQDWTRVRDHNKLPSR